MAYCIKLENLLKDENIKPPQYIIVSNQRNKHLVQVVVLDGLIVNFAYGSSSAIAKSRAARKAFYALINQKDQFIKDHKSELKNAESVQEFVWLFETQPSIFKKNYELFKSKHE